jgi:hypothetical protein
MPILRSNDVGLTSLMNVYGLKYYVAIVFSSVCRFMEGLFTKMEKNLVAALTVFI